MTLPPLNTPIQHTGGDMPPVKPDTVVAVRYRGDHRFTEPAPAFAVHWPNVTTYTIIARAPADEIAALKARVTELQGVMEAMQKQAALIRGDQAYREFPRFIVKTIRAALKGNPNAHD